MILQTNILRKLETQFNIWLNIDLQNVCILSAPHAD